MTIQSGLRLSCNDIPENDVTVRIAGGDEVVVGAICGPCHRCRVAFPFRQQFPLGEIPGIDQFVGADRDGLAAVGTGDGPVDRTGVPAECVQRIGSWDVPEPQTVVG